MFIKYCVFSPRILESLPPLLRQHSVAIGCTKNYQPIGVLYTRITLRDLKVSYSAVGEGGVAVNFEKNPQFFLNTLYVYNNFRCDVTSTDCFVRLSVRSSIVSVFTDLLGAFVHNNIIIGSVTTP